MTTAALAPFESAPRWVAWRNEIRGGKMTKVPYSPAGGPAKANDPRTWGTRAAAEERARTLVNGKGGGVGIELGDLGDGTSLAGADLDTCRMPNGTFEPWAAEIIEKLGSYCEVSPSNTGAKTFFRYRTEDLPLLHAAMGGTRHSKMFKKRANGGVDHPPAIELHFSNRYFTVTARRLASVPDQIVTVPIDTLLWILNEAGPAFAGAGAGSKRKTKTDPGEPKPQADDDSTEGCGTDQSRSGKAFGVACQARREGRTYDEMVELLRNNPDTVEWLAEKGEPNNGYGLKRIWHAAGAAVGVTINDFYAYMPMASYIFTPTRTIWPSNSINARIAPIDIGNREIKASTWLDQNRPVEQMTWAPGLPEIISDRLLLEGGWVNRPGLHCFNLYRPPAIIPGAAHRADRWVEHVRLVYPNEMDHILDWLAHRVQRPHEKINHALVFGGKPGIGKDTILEPVKPAVGAWNFQEAVPTQVLGRFNSFLKSVILRISEARDLGEFDRYKLYDHLKVFIAAPPDTLRIDEKHLREHSILNVCGVIITTNYKTDGIYLPSDDRRHFVVWSDLDKEDECFAGDYWDGLYGYFANGGNEAVAAYLAQRDIRSFNSKASPPKTPAFWAIADANRSPEEPELADVLDQIFNPAAITLGRLQNNADGDFQDWLKDRRNRRIIPHRLEKCGYVPVRNPTAEDGLWKVSGRRQAVYARKTLTLRDQIEAARKL